MLYFPKGPKDISKELLLLFFERGGGGGGSVISQNMLIFGGRLPPVALTIGPLRYFGRYVCLNTWKRRRKKS